MSFMDGKAEAEFTEALPADLFERDEITFQTATGYKSGDIVQFERADGASPEQRMFRVARSISLGDDTFRVTLRREYAN